MRHGTSSSWKRCKPTPCDACTTARREYMRAYRVANADDLKAKAKAYYEANKHWRNKKTPEQNRNSTLWARYRLRPDAYAALLESQNGRCAICRVDSPVGKNEWSVDHDHACCPENGRSCGECIRGLLCGPCNVGIGMFKDSPELLQAAIDYLVTLRKL